MLFGMGADGQKQVLSLDTKTALSLMLMKALRLRRCMISTQAIQLYMLSEIHASSPCNSLPHAHNLLWMRCFLA